MKSNRIGLIALLCASLSGAALAHHAAASLRAGFPAEDDLAFLPRASVLRAASLGHTEAMADLVFLRTITFFGAQFVGAKNYDWMESHLDTVAELDPYFRAAYRFGGHATMYNGKPITNREVRLSSHFLEAGLQVY